MSIIGSNILAGAAGSGVSAYEIEQSLRFDGSQKLTRTPSSAGNRKTWTLSAWLKLTVNHFSTTATHQLMHVPGSGYTSQLTYVPANWYSSNPGQLYWDAGQAGGSGTRLCLSKQRDASAWYHIVWRADYTNASVDNKAQFWVNGVLQPSQTSSYAMKDADGMWNSSGVVHTLFGHPSGSPYAFAGYAAEVHHVDGTALDADSFGEYDDNGVWRPIEYTGSYGTNGFYLKFDPSATNGIGHDHSGNGNNWTASAGFVTSGTGTDVMSDTPTSNFATLNPLIGYQVGGLLAPTFSNGNLTVAPKVDSGNNSRVASATLARNPADGGVWRWEMVVNSTNNSFYGIQAINENTGQGSFGPYWGASGLGGNLSTSGGASANLQEQHATISAGDVITIVVSFDDNEIGWYINGTRTGFYNGCNFSNYDQIVPFFKESTRTQTPCTFDVNFGQKAFQYTTSGDSWGDLSLLPAPDIADGSDYFNTVLYTGNSSTQSITGVGFQPDWVWAKSRDEGYSHYLYDIVRGAGKYINTNNTNTEVNDTTTLSSFNTDGFSLGSAPGTNNNTKRYVAWNWLAGNGTSSNTDGSITSTVSANATAGFSIVSYVGTQAADTIAHGLGVAPSMIICKDRDVADRWPVYHSALGNAKNLRLDNTTAAESDSGIWNSTSPTSTVFSVGTSVRSNRLNSNYIAYCFAEVEGYSKFGSYTGNGNADGPFVYCGFRPAWVLIKNSNSATDWHLFDTARDPSNEVTQALYPDTGGSEDTLTNNEIDILSNGFKPRSAGSSTNGSGNTLIFAAFSENPFGGSGVSPATAR